MKRLHSITVLLAVLLFSTACEKEEVVVEATEVWQYIMDNDSTKYGQATFEKLSDGTITEDAQWYFPYQDTLVTCIFENGTVVVADTLISITAQGIATNPRAPSGYQSSAFSINVNGSARNGHSSGTWTINFATYGWPSPLQGTFIGTRTSGSGITK